MAEKIVGILGGMGPEATVDLLQRIVRLTPALDDIDHIHCIVDNNPKVPSRIKAIIEKDGDDPGSCMADMARRLEAYGADFLVIACNTAHYYYKSVQEAVAIPVINLIGLVSDYFKINYPDQHQVGILASPAIAMTGLYSERFKKLGIKDIWPDSIYQDRLFKVIKDVKKGKIDSMVITEYQSVCEHLYNRGVKTAVVACTELSALCHNPLDLKTIDAAQVLAKEIVQVVKHSKKISSYALPVE